MVNSRPTSNTRRPHAGAVLLARRERQVSPGLLRLPGAPTGAREQRLQSRWRSGTRPRRPGRTSRRRQLRVTLRAAPTIQWQKDLTPLVRPPSCRRGAGSRNQNCSSGRGDHRRIDADGDLSSPFGSSCTTACAPADCHQRVPRKLPLAVPWKTMPLTLGMPFQTRRPKSSTASLVAARLRRLGAGHRLAGAVARSDATPRRRRRGASRSAVRRSSSACRRAASR